MSESAPKARKLAVASVGRSEQPDAPDQCEFVKIVQGGKKHIPCTRTKAADSCYCTHHTTICTASIDIACPFNSAHKCAAKNLEAHKKKCPDRPGQTPVVVTHALAPPVFSAVHLGGRANPFPDARPRVTPIRELAPELIQRIYDRVVALPCTDPTLHQLNDQVHPSFFTLFSTAEQNSVNYGRMLKQESQLVRVLRDRNLLPTSVDPDSVHSDTSPFMYAELGAGKGKLSRHLQSVLHAQHTPCDHRLVDRMTFRSNHCVDLEMRGTAVAANRTFARIAADLRGLDMNLLAPQRPGSLICIGKHLCGSAMDLSLDSLTATIPEQVHGICISTCCHHLCSLREYVGQAMFDRLKWTTEEVEAAIALSSWATLKNTSDDHNDAAKTAPNMIEPSSSELESSALNEHSPETAGDAADCSSQTSLTVQQRIELGYRCKRLLDQGRCEFLQAAGFQTALECFTQCSRENVALVAFR